MFVLKAMLCLVWLIPSGDSSRLWAQNASSERSGSERSAPQLIYSSFGQFQDYEKRFSLESKNTLPDGVSPQRLVEGFAKACQIINSVLLEIETMQKELHELNGRLEALRRSGSLSYYATGNENGNAGDASLPDERGVLSDSGESDASVASSTDPFADASTVVSSNLSVAPSGFPSGSVPSRVPAGDSEDASGKATSAVEIRARIGILQERIVQKKLLIQSLYAQTQEWIAPVWNLAPRKPEVLRYMLFLLACAIDSDQYEAAYVLSRELMAQNVYESEPVLYEMAGISAFMVGKLDVAQFCFTEALKRGTLTQTAVRSQELIPYCSQAWRTELTLRGCAKAKGELPRVLLETSKGNVEIELFENSFPETTAAFVGLVRSGFYDGMIFSTVISGKFARLGSARDIRVSASADLQNTETWLTALARADEESRSLFRSNLRGSLVLLPGKNGLPARFEILLTPAPERDGRSFVFGRVTKGMDVVSSFTRSDGDATGKKLAGEALDRIVSAKALNR